MIETPEIGREYLQPGEEQTVRLVVSSQDQSIWDVANNAWKFVPGSKVYVGASSRDIRLTGG